MSTDKYTPSGQLQGDTKPMPDRGTGTGLNGDTYGADISGNATNRLGGLGNATRSDAPFEGDSDMYPDGDD